MLTVGPTPVATVKPLVSTITPVSTSTPTATSPPTDRPSSKLSITTIFNSSLIS